MVYGLFVSSVESIVTTAGRMIGAVSISVIQDLEDGLAVFPQDGFHYLAVLLETCLHALHLHQLGQGLGRARPVESVEPCFREWALTRVFPTLQVLVLHEDPVPKLKDPAHRVRSPMEAGSSARVCGGAVPGQLLAQRLREFANE